MRKKLIIGNWKMNFNMQEASLYLHKLMNTLPSHRDVEVVLAPTILTLQSLSLQINRRNSLSWRPRIAIGEIRGRTREKFQRRIFVELLIMY